MVLVLAGVCLGAARLGAQPAEDRLINISTRGQVGTGDNILIGGFVIGGGASKTVLVRAVGPGLDRFGVPGTLPDPMLRIFNGDRDEIAANDDWQPADAAVFDQVFAFDLKTGSKDAAIVLALPPGNYTAQVSGLGPTRTGVVLLEAYDVSGNGTLLNISTRLQVGTGADVAISGFVVNPGGGPRKVLVRGVGPGLGTFGLNGLLPDPKLELLDQRGARIALAAANGKAAVLGGALQQSGAFTMTADDTAVIATLTPGNYTAMVSGNRGDTTGLAIVEVYDITNTSGTPASSAGTPVLYYASLRPSSAATTSSTASGYATILYDGNTNVATVSVNFSNLSSSATAAHLVAGDSAASGNYVFNLPRGQANALTWTFSSRGAYTTADLIAALQSGHLFVAIESASFPGGELQGGFARTTGSTTFTPPAAPPTLPPTALTNPTQTDAARFLTQATFGPTVATINALQTRGISGWIDDQMALPATSALAALRADLAAFPNPPLPPTITAAQFAWQANWNAAWWKMAVKAPDQLRQRVAFALSEIFVVGQQDDLDFNLESKARYYDLLIHRAFGSYRALLEDVSLSPAMGVWLSHRGNLKANPVKGTAPDENYAREVMQLFSIGLVQLQPDGSLLLDAQGQPIPTYNQETVSETAKVFTGWTWSEAPATSTDENRFTSRWPWTPTNYPAPLPDTSAWLVPMRGYDAFHDKTAKRIVCLQQVPLGVAQPTELPANQTCAQDLAATLDTLFNHPNTGPFICRQLIQRLVTSNPSPGYVHRVAQVFANDGSGTRGNLGAVVRAILTDYEARSPAVLDNAGYGKIKEPLIRMAAFLRALNGAAPNGRYMDSYFGDPRGYLGYIPAGFFQYPQYATAQAPLWSQTVFNFFSPTYSPPGAMAAAGLVAPELEITDSNFAIQVPNQLVDLMYRNPATLPQPPSGPSPFIVLDYSALLPNARSPGVLADQLSLLFCSNQMSAGTRAQIVATLNSFPAAATDLERVQTAIQFTIASPDSALQR